MGCEIAAIPMFSCGALESPVTPSCRMGLLSTKHGSPGGRVTRAMTATAKEFRDRAKKCRAEALVWARRAKQTNRDQERAAMYARAWHVLAGYVEQKARESDTTVVIEA